jgi:hypothetical protein
VGRVQRARHGNDCDQGRKVMLLTSTFELRMNAKLVQLRFLKQSTSILTSMMYYVKYTAILCSLLLEKY